MARKPKKMAIDDSELIAALKAEYAQASQDGNDTISQQRVDAGYSFVNRDTDKTIPTTNMSGVRLLFTPSAVQTLVSHQSKIFCSHKDTVVFSPSCETELHSQAASQLSKMVNMVLHRKNPGFTVITDVLRSAAVYKNGIVKTIWAEKPEIIEEMLSDIDPAQLEVIIQEREAEGWDVKVKEKSETTEMVEETGMDPFSGDQITVASTQTMGSYTLRLERMKGQITVECLPPEEFLINQGTTSINDSELTHWVAHRKLMLKGDVEAMFPDADTSRLTTASELGDNYEKETRHFFDATYDDYNQGGYTELTKTVEVVENWIRADRDGDGYPEWRHVFTSGDMILMDEEHFGPLPFASFTFFPAPHKFYGLSVYDRLYSLEQSATGLIRSALDFTRLSNTFRLLAKAGTIDARTLNSGRPGVIPVDKSFSPEDIFAVPTPSGQGLGTTLPLLQELRQQVIGEIGIDPISGQVSTDIEKSGNDAAKTAMAIDNASVKMEAYSRMFADGTLRDIIWCIATYLVKYKDTPFVMDVLESCTPGQPFIAGEMGLENIMSKSDLKAKVGLGHQTGQQKIQAAQILGGLMQQLAQDPTQAMYNLVLNAAEGLGFEDAVAIVGSIESYMQKAQQNQQAMQAQTQQAQAAAQEAQQRMQLEIQRFEFEKELKMMQTQEELAIKRMEAEAKIELNKASALQKISQAELANRETNAIDEAAQENVQVII